jgi:hypothetical protein
MQFQILAAKDPGATLTYQFDWTAYFAAVHDTLDSAIVEVVDDNRFPIASDLLVESVQATFSGVVTAWLTGGTAGREYKLRCSIEGANTDPERIRDCRTVIVPVREK